MYSMVIFLLSFTVVLAGATETDPPDFHRCYNEKIKTFNVSSPGSPLLWPKEETGLRILYFIVPILLLSARYAYAPIGISNKLWTFVHLVGDPIDSLWSTLLRQEKARRNYHFAMEIAPGAPREVAAIWTAYDLWWQDPAAWTRNNLKQQMPENLDDGDPVPDLLTRREIYRIKNCALQLAKNRSTNLVLSWIAIIIFLGSLVGAYIRTATTQKHNQTSHTLAIVMLFSFLVFAVYISGHVGNFKRVTDVISELQELHDYCGDLFPPLEGCAVPGSLPETNTFQGRFEKSAIYAGVNHSWRPNKSLEELNHSDRSTWLLFGVSFLVVSIAWLFAFLLSYRTPRIGFGCRSITWTCIYVAWVISATFDFVRSFFPPRNAEATRRWWIYGSIPKDTFITLSIMTLVVVVQFGYFNNCRCLAGNFLEKLDPKSICIDLGPVTPEQLAKNWIMWLMFPICGMIGILLFIFVAGYEGEGGRMLFYRTDSDLRSEERAMKTMQTRLNIIPVFPPSPGDSEEEWDAPRRDGQQESHPLRHINIPCPPQRPPPGYPSLRRRRTDVDLNADNFQQAHGENSSAPLLPA
ncbi:hypothetical protein BCR34DRAFT_591254 [Clohesyomyces aquaticus]|uniref:Uncharacterized protein n=1 Tax=Clohesyomyces aquaticus TaxID=1231657 RepID=A0A1Y1Z269_9PLEO|nr:hypothetical protein BCR34DRAFT_591254 [Clohesyomyces aquaticus]